MSKSQTLPVEKEWENTGIKQVEKEVPPIRKVSTIYTTKKRWARNPWDTKEISKEEHLEYFFNDEWQRVPTKIDYITI
jgi:hypothetical protein